MALERSKDRLHSPRRVCYGPAVRALQFFGARRRESRELDHRTQVRRLAGAPISWGVCEVPGWGRQLEPSRVFGEMTAVGLDATELGPVGYLPLDAAQLRETLGRFHMRLGGGVVAPVVHEASLHRAPQATR